MSDRRIASRLAFTSLLCGLIWLELGGMVSAQQVSADEIINALSSSDGSIELSRYPGDHVEGSAVIG
jgi:hypothetical protein